MSKQAVISIARAELSVKEDPPGSNRVKYNTAYYGREVSGKDFPWCVTLQWWVFQEAGERMAFFGGGKTASCRTLLRWYREQGLTADKQAIQVGDILIQNFSGKMRDGELDTEHCGLVVEKGPLAGTWYCVEGNTSPGEEGSQDNGGCVALKLRSVKNVVGVCRPQYKPEEANPTVPDYKGRWSEAYWEEGIRRGIITESKDGIYRPKDTVTREEVLAMILRNDGYHG